jgi:hypothetical protein
MFIKQEDIVYMGSLPEGEYSPSSHHLSLLQEVVKDRLKYFSNFKISSSFTILV